MTIGKSWQVPNFFQCAYWKNWKDPKVNHLVSPAFFSALNHHEIFKGEMGEIPRDLGLQSGHVPEFAEHVQQRVHQHLARATMGTDGTKI